ncbi:preprotein translocase subunit Sec61beta [Candidatus Pacearchaeota archaeon]|nr:preprotein translocase subunit Sec61beta [Candidatus Pacearchaeota archaeon]
MAENSSVNLPGGFGGLMRYNEEYASRFNLKPTHVILFVVLIVALRVALPIIIK